MGNGIIYSRQIIQCNNLVGILTPVGVVQKRVIHIGSHLNAEIRVATIKHILTDVHIRRLKHLVIVASVRNQVEHVECLQVLTIHECTVVDDHVQHGVCIG